LTEKLWEELKEEVPNPCYMYFSGGNCLSKEVHLSSEIKGEIQYVFRLL